MSLRDRWRLHGKEMFAEFDGSPMELAAVLLSAYTSYCRDFKWPIYVPTEYAQLLSDNGIIMRGAERTNGTRYYLTDWGVLFIEYMFAFGLKSFLSRSGDGDAV